VLAGCDAVAHAANGTEITIDVAASLVSESVAKIVDESIGSAATEHSELHENVLFCLNPMILSLFQTMHKLPGYQTINPSASSPLR
jgi:hypothetical protein